jgi:hypothetical protein
MTKKIPSLWSILEDNSGGFSAMRFMFIFTTVFFLFIWGLTCYMNHKIEPFPKESTTIILGLAGIKMAQRFGENGELDTSVN